MSRGFPSMTALLGLLAIAGYQNRDKIAEMLGGGQNTPGGSATGSGLGGLLGQLSGGLGAGGVGGLLSNGLGELVDRFKQSGQADTVDSWVGTGPNKQIAPTQVEQAIGPDVLAMVAPQCFKLDLSELGRQAPCRHWQRAFALPACVARCSSPPLPCCFHWPASTR